MNAAIRFVSSEPWAITSDALRVIATVARREGEGPESVAAKLGRPLDNTHKVTIRDGVAVIPVRGPISRYANLFSQISGGTSIDKLGTDLGQCLANPAVRAILLEIDSPGGQANGISEMASMIREGTKSKPICAYIGGTGASAAYWLASAASEVVVSESAIVGSIGVILAMDDEDDDGEMRFVSSQSPNKDPKPGTEKGRAEIQAMVDSLAQVFIDSVAAYRGVKPDEVVSKFGEGGVRIGKQAVKCGMADRVGSFESCLAELCNSSSKRPGRPAMSSSKGTPFMTLSERVWAWFARNKPEEFAATVNSALAEQTPTEPPKQFSMDEALAVLRLGGIGAGPSGKPALSEADLEAEINKRAEAKAAELAAKHAETAVKAQAKTFVAAMVKDERIQPLQAPAFEALFADLALADQVKPLKATIGGKEATVSRLDFFTGSVKGTPKHGLTTERVIEDPDKLPEGLKLFPNTHADTSSGKPAASDPAKLAKLLALTDEGKAALKELSLANAK